MATVGMVVKLGIHATYLLHLRNMHEFVGIIHGCFKKGEYTIKTKAADTEAIVNQ